MEEAGSMEIKRVSGWCVCALFWVGAIAAQAAAQSQPKNASGYAVFGGNAVNITDMVSISDNRYSTGYVGSNGDLTNIGHSFGSMGWYIGGDYVQPEDSFVAIQHDAVIDGTVSRIGNGVFSWAGGNFSVGGSVVLDSFSVDGDLASGGDVAVSNAVMSGDIRSAGHTSIHLTSVYGSIEAAGNVELVDYNDVMGHITYGGTLSVSLASDVIGGASMGSPVVTPIGYAPVHMPKPVEFNAGGLDIHLAPLSDRTLAPGAYGSIHLDDSSDLFLSSGDYFFNNITATGEGASIHYDLEQGPIRVFVENDVLISDANIIIDSDIYGHSSDEDAVRLFWQVNGSFHGHVNFVGTLYAPYGDITLYGQGDGYVIGSLIAGDTVTVGNVHIDHVAYIPEPTSLALLALGGAACLRRRAG